MPGEFEADANEIARDLLGLSNEEEGDVVQGDGGPEGSATPGAGDPSSSVPDGTSNPDGTSPAPAPPPIDPAALVPDDVPMPKAWKKELEPLWKSGITDPNVRKYIAEREAQISQGIQQYHKGHTNWTKLTEPFAQALANRPDFTEEHQVQLMQNLMASHIRMLTLPADQRVEFAKKLLQGYGVDFGQVAQVPELPREVQTRLARVDELEGRLNEYMLRENQKVVDAFMSDPKNPYARELINEIHGLLSTGQAKDLQSAYEQAQWLNEAVRQKILDKQFADRQREANEAAEKTRKLNGLNRGGSGENDGPPSSRKKAKTVDETIDEVVAKHEKSL